MKNLCTIGPQHHTKKLPYKHAGWLRISQSRQIGKRVRSHFSQACSHMVSRLILRLFSAFGIILLSFHGSDSASSLSWLKLTFERCLVRRALRNRAPHYSRSHLKVRLEIQVFLTCHPYCTPL